MPEAKISHEQEEELETWLWRKANSGVMVDNVECRMEESILFDRYNIGTGYLNFHTDTSDRDQLNQIECDDQTADELRQIGIEFIEPEVEEKPE